MIKRKLLAVIGGSMSVVVAAATALTLAISGPRQTQSLLSLSDSEAVSQGVTNLFSSAYSSFDTVNDVLDTIQSNKAALSVGLNINEMADSPELNGFGGKIKLNCDADNQKYSVDLSAAYGSVELINALVYMDASELRAYMPAIIDGVLVVPCDNLEENLKNSYIGSLLEAEGFDYDEYKAELDEYMAMWNEAAADMPELDFDYEEFVEDLSDVMNSAYQDAIDSMSVTDNGMQPLKGGSYQCYTASVSVADLSYIIRDAIMFALTDDEFLKYIEDVSEYMNSVSDEYDDYSDLSNDYSVDMATQLKGVASMLDSYWSMVVSEVEAVLGKNIEFTIYLSDTVETAGFEFYMSQNADESFNYSKAATATADEYISLKGDFTGGAEIGDYANIVLEVIDDNTVAASMEYSFQSETNGDFNLDLTMISDGYTDGIIHADGSYTENGPYFNLTVDSFKYVDETGSTIYDLGFSLAFEEISGVDKPTASTEYNIWEMSENDFMNLLEDLYDKIEVLDDLLN